MGDVAMIAGVSSQTVSRVSNEKTNVDQATMERVLAAMKQVVRRRYKRVLEDVCLAEGWPTQRRGRACRADDLREVAHQQPRRLAVRAHSVPAGGIGGTSPTCPAASIASE